MSLSPSVCEPWATLDDLFDCTDCSSLLLLESQGGPVADSVALNNLLIASNILNRLTAFQFGLCEETVRPCCPDDLCGVTVPIDRGNREAHWYHVVSSTQPGCVAYVCGTALPQLDFSVYPLDSITSVMVDGVALDSANYRIDEYKYLVRIDGQGWPTAQDLLKADTETGTWAVTYKYGMAPPPEGVKAVAELACHLTLACAPADLASRCKLPDYVTTVTRQGITFDLMSVEEMLRGKFVGLPFVDRFVSYVNPEGLSRPPIVISPTYNRSPHRRVGT